MIFVFAAVTVFITMQREEKKPPSPFYRFLQKVEPLKKKPDVQTDIDDTWKQMKIESSNLFFTPKVDPFDFPNILTMVTQSDVWYKESNSVT